VRERDIEREREKSTTYDTKLIKMGEKGEYKKEP